jgi:predicted RNA-binding Zn ribbon-like protein
MLISRLRQDLCVDYANTRFWRGRPVASETLHTFADLLRWLEASAGMDAQPLRELASWARNEPKAAMRFLGAALHLREALYRIFGALAGGTRPRGRDIAALQKALAAAPARNRLAATASVYGWEMSKPRRSVPHLLAPVLWSAGDLITGAARDRLRRCANDACLWLFLDDSKNATRRWCAMASCGNRAKARRHYLKVTRAQA